MVRPTYSAVEARVHQGPGLERRPVLVTNPADDASFRRFADSCLQSTGDPARLEAMLRERYPAAVVHPRLLAGEPWLIWYVYRDGRWVARGSRSGDRR